MSTKFRCPLTLPNMGAKLGDTHLHIENLHLMPSEIVNTSLCSQS